MSLKQSVFFCGTNEVKSNFHGLKLSSIFPDKLAILYPFLLKDKIEDKMFSRFAHKITKGNIKPATVDSPSNVLVVGATSQVGFAIVEELQQGSFARMFKVHAAVVPDESPAKLQKLKDLGVDYFPFDLRHMSQAEDFINKFEINALVLTNAALMESTKAGRAWIDTGRRVSDDSFE